MIIAGVAGARYGGYKGFKYLKGKLGKEEAEKIAKDKIKKEAFKSGDFTFKNDNSVPKSEIHSSMNEYLRKRGYTNSTIERDKAVEEARERARQEFVGPKSEAWVL